MKYIVGNWIRKFMSFLMWTYEMYPFNLKHMRVAQVTHCLLKSFLDVQIPYLKSDSNTEFTCNC